MWPLAALIMLAGTVAGRFARVAGWAFILLVLGGLMGIGWFLDWVF